LDGGNLDYTGVYPLLRRQIPKLMVMVNTEGEPVRLDTTANPNVIHMPESIAYMWGLQRRNDGEQWKTFANDPIPDDIARAYTFAFRNNQVFNNISQFDQLSQDMLAAVNAGEPLCKKQRLTVQANSFWGIQSYEVLILWCINQINRKWEERLSPDGQAILAEIQSDNGDVFPEYNTFKIQLNEAEVGMAANMWATTFLDDNYNGEFRSFMASTVANDVSAANAPLINAATPPATPPSSGGGGATTPSTTNPSSNSVPAAGPPSSSNTPTFLSGSITVQPCLFVSTLVALCLFMSLFE